jgi:hypothetical protein
MAIAAIRTKILEAVDVPFNELAQFSFHRIGRFQKVLDAEHFVGGKVLRLFTLRDLCRGERSLADRRTHSIKICERDLDPLIIRNVHTENTHDDSLALALFMFGILAANKKLAISLYDLAA